MIPYFSLILATTNEGVIGYDSNRIPWDSSIDRKYFTDVTKSNDSNKIKKPINVVIMGRKTFETLKTPLKDRINIVISRTYRENSLLNKGCILVNTLEKAFEASFSYFMNESKIFIIGGTEIYEKTIIIDKCEKVYVTYVLNTNIIKMNSIERSLIEPDKHRKLNCLSNQFFDILNSFKLENSTIVDENENTLIFETRVRERNTDEKYYLSLCWLIINYGEKRSDRTGTGTLSLFDPGNLKFDLRKGFPLLTTKKVFFKGVVVELLWFLSGDTNVRYVEENGVKIWRENTSREFLDKVGLKDYPVGELGPGYGFQWRNFGGTYRISDVVGEIKSEKCNERSNQSEKDGVDQILFCINEIKENPTSRRICVSAWNPKTMKDTALPPCHYFFQFYVGFENGMSKYLDMKFNMRSCDVFLGLPFNIASYSLLLILIADQTDLIPRYLSVSFGDAHIYSNHLENVKKQLKRNCRDFPFVKCKKRESIDLYEIDDIELIDYYPHPTIVGKMAV